MSMIARYFLLILSFFMVCQASASQLFEDYLISLSSICGRSVKKSSPEREWAYIVGHPETVAFVSKVSSEDLEVHLRTFISQDDFYGFSNFEKIDSREVHLKHQIGNVLSMLYMEKKGVNSLRSLKLCGLGEKHASDYVRYVFFGSNYIPKSRKLDLSENNYFKVTGDVKNAILGKAKGKAEGVSNCLSEKRSGE